MTRVNADWLAMAIRWFELGDLEFSWACLLLHEINKEDSVPT